MMAREVLENCHKTISASYVALGQSMGQTLLPQPPANMLVAEKDRASRDKDRVHVLETAVVTWTNQIKAVLKTEPEGVLNADGFPGPLQGVEFWTEKANNLARILQQLEGEGIGSVMTVLEMTSSPYFTAFATLVKDVGVAHAEAADNVKFLAPLIPYFRDLRDLDDFSQLSSLFRPIMHLLLLAWKHSKYYNTPPCMVVLICEICNDLIEQSRNHISPATVFEDEPPEAIERLDQARRVCTEFKSAFYEYNQTAAVECPDKPWKFQSKALFSRLDDFLERCDDLIDVLQTVTHFNRLERVDIGGNKGHELTTYVADVYRDFQAELAKWQACGYDVLDLSGSQFAADYLSFTQSIKRLEQILGGILNMGFDDAGTITGAFKLFDSFADLLERDFVQSDLESKQISLIRRYGEELSEVQSIFNSSKLTSCAGKHFERDGPPLYINMPPISGALAWVQGLIFRMEAPMKSLRPVLQAMHESDEAKDVSRMHESISKALADYETSIFGQWAQTVDGTLSEKLTLPLLTKDEASGEVSVNFDPQLIKLLNEVKYFVIQKKDVPGVAMELYEKAELFRVQTGSLELMRGNYNWMLRSLLEVERPLLQGHMKNIDKLMQRGLTDLKWQSPEVEKSAFVDELSTLVADAHGILTSLKTNMKGVESVLKKWSDTPLLVRRAAKTYVPDVFMDEHAQQLDVRYKEITDGGKEIHQLLLDSNQILKVPKGAPAWRSYVEFINGMFIDGVSATIIASLKFVLSLIDPAVLAQSDNPPLLEVKLELRDSNPLEVCFSPPLDSVASRGRRDSRADGKPVGDGKSIAGYVNRWMTDFYNIVKLVKRLDRQEGDFVKEMEEDEQVRFYVHRINSEIEAASAACNQLTEPFVAHKELWLKDIQTQLQSWLEEGSAAAPTDGGDAAAAADAEESTSGAEVTNLGLFDERIVHYKAIEDEIRALPPQSFQGWLKVDARPVKNALATWAAKWGLAHTDHLKHYIQSKLENLVSFCDEIDRGLAETPEDNDAQALIAAMTHVHNVRMKESEFDTMFEPIKNTIALLKKHNITMSDAVLEGLEQAPFKWENTKKTTLNAREVLHPLQSMQQEKVKDEIETFKEKVVDFVARFKAEAPFSFSIGPDAAYALLNQWNVLLDEIEAESQQLSAEMELFEVQAINFREIGECRKSLQFLKVVWDHVQLVLEIFTSYKNTLWARVDTDVMIDETKKLQKEIKVLPRQAMKWDVYQGLVKIMSEMAIDLPLVQDLRDDAMRERHWQKLMATCGKSFILDNKLQLESLLALQLHDFQDGVSEVVEQARAEIKLEAQLKKIAHTWSGLNLEYAPFKNTGVQILQQPPDVYEALDDNEVVLQNMKGNRFMGFFETQITDWAGKLGTVRSVLEVWLEVQRSWCSLESIFLGSEDIREQLPEDAKRFDQIDSEFREQMTDAVTATSPIDVCTAQGREEAFNKCLANLELCQKSLSDYLEVKKRRFPRFYFISAVDLVDILSKGRNPPMVQEHFSKFTDATGGITWAKDEATGAETGLAQGCVSIDKELFPYPEPYQCSGQVEDWLNGLMDHQQGMLRQRLFDCINAYVEVPREQWVGMYIAQLCITTSQVHWTSEVYTAFDRLEQGNEQAMKEYLQQCMQGLSMWANMVLGDLSKEMRVKIKTLITIDVHGRDIVKKLIDEKVDNAQAFAWQCQLKYSWDEPRDDCYINICDAEFKYSYEYVGNPGRLVITALTDRCYITLTQALRLIMGGAPAGPAGTGKTETTKDLGRGLAIWVIVMNCSDQMNAKVMANIFSGLAQTGAWGCFDEFNRIAVEVLSVVAGQYSSVLQGIRAGKTEFLFEEETINLKSSVGAFITMNPGYAGRTELPENLKALFRPCAMVVPDFENIAEINLAGEGFQDSKNLAHKFVELYYMSRELLSKQHHYDWGLRAMTGVLRIAGGMKRAEPDKSEAQILMRALRDTNLPKFVAADYGIFGGLILDLFPRVECPPQVNEELSKAVKTVIAKGGRLVAEEVFVRKICNLSEMMDVRHCVFVLGCAGSGKSELWRTLADAQTELKVGGGSTKFVGINPKSVTTNDLYGYVHPVTKEPYDGIIAKAMREQSKSTSTNPKWIVLDDDIDAEWIESMNTVMDDNKVLTLVSNERIPLTAPMRMIFEISHLRNASPATVSRAGVIFMNEDDVGWKPYVQMWVEGMGDQKTQAILEQLFEQFVTPTLDYARKEKWKHVTPLMDFAMVQVVCKILEGLLTPANCPPGSEKDVYEVYFQFATIWALGGAYGSDKGADFRKVFDAYWRGEFSKTTLKFPEGGLVFDYFIDPNTGKGEPKKLLHWNEIIPTYKHDRTAPYQTLLVPTMDTTRIKWLASMMLNLKKPVMLVGNAGSAKTVLLSSMLSDLDEDAWATYNISFNSFTEASDLQFMMEQPLEKKTGSTFGPPGNKRLVYFIDDINMSTPDKYGTQPPIALMRQQVDYGGFYDLKKLSMKKLENVQYVASMNPTSGSFFIIDRLQRHYATIATPFPDTDVLRHIYINIMGGHLEVGFAAAMRDALPSIVDAACAVHVAVADTFLPTAIKFHYQWNLRAMAGVFQGLINMNPATYKEPMNMARLWLHETVRVYGDRMTTPADFDKLQEILLKKAKDHLGDLEQEELLAEPNLFASFVTESDQKVYLPLKDWDHVNGILEAKLAEYNDNFAQMNLVLFNMAMEHLCRISRIIDNPRGNAMLVGVGGSGKQSLTRLAAFIGGYETFQMKLTATYGMNDFKDDLRALYTKVGAKSTPTVFLFTDQQIFKERCLVYFNDILAQGCPPDLFSDEDKDPLINAVRTEAKAAGLANDTRESLWGFFVDKVRANLHLVICMSPVGDDFRNRCRKFPALTNCTTIDWFFSWPEQALISVAQRFLEDVEMATPELRSACAHHMAFVHESVGHSAELYKAQERRNVYTTPKSFLELIDLYKLQLSKERDANEVLKLRLQDGLVKLRDAQEQVADMQVQLKEESEFVAQKKLETNALLEQVGKESVIADEQSALAAIEEEKVTKVQEDVSEFQKACYAELAAAEPAIKKAEAALNGLNKNSLTELKSLANPPAPVLNVTAAVQYMTAPKGTNLKKLDVSWAGAKKMMGSADAFLQMLQAFDKDGFLPENKEFVRKYTGPADNPNPEFNAEFMASKSGAAAGLCDWIVNICIYHDIYLDVEPKRQKLAEAEATLEEANTKLEQVRAQVKALEDRKAELQGQLEESVAAKNELEAKADATAKRANLAQRLVNGLYDEGVRWDANVATLDDKARLLVGNVLVASSFIAYIAPFNSQFRSQLVQEKWIPDSINRSIPIADGFEPMHLLSDASAIAEWRTEGLPADPLSSENAAIITKCSRFPLIIDPQLQAINWIAGREEPNGLVRLTLDQKNYLDKVVRALEEGLPMVIENMGEEIDAVLDNMIARAFIKKGSKLQVKLGDRDTDIMVQKTADGQNTSDPAFRLYMQTKLPNPDYIPEIQAQTTVVNFTVTEKGLEDQLLAVVVGKERPDLLEEQSSLIKQNNEFVIKLKELEDNLLYLLATAEGDILANEELIVSLEVTKATVKDINAKVEAAKITEASVAKAFESYRPNGNRGSLMYFIMNQLCIIDHMYQYSLAAFKFIFDKALAKAEPAESVEERVANLQDSITYTVFSFVTRGLFERHRLIFATQLAVKVLLGQTNDKGEPAIKSDELMLLIRNPRDNSKENPLQSWLPDAAWGSVQALASVEEFASLPADVEGSWKRWKEWCEFEQPEANPLPQEWKKLSGFHQLLIIRAMRPDRMTLAISRWVEQVLGAKYGTAINFDLLLSFEDSGPAVPIFFLLSPGVDPAADVRALGKTMGKTEDEGKFQGVSLGQGQEPVAEKALDQGYVEGGWVMLENIELVANWLPKLEKKLASLEEGAHPEFRVFLTAMPQKVVPVPILQKSIKLTNEPPSGLKANLLRAFKNFDATIWESSSKQGELKAIIFSLCFFHSVVCERRKFGPMGWNRGYPFNTGDLMVCIAVANNYLETNSKIPWDDLRYLFGEIMYGGHITDNWDRRLCTTFLQAYVREELVEGIALYPGFQSPPNLSYKEYLEYVEENIERETPAAYGLHPNSEINFMTRQAEDLFSAISELQPRGGGGEGGMTMGERVKQQLDEILEKLPELFLMIEIEERVEERTPYVAFFLQECERMNLLVFEMGRSLRELDAGLRGDLSISQPMEDLMNALFENRVPSTWEALAWPSLAPLSPWLADFLDRQRQLVEWTADLNTPKVTWISGLFNPQAFLTAVMQVTARKNEWPLDRVVTTVDVTKRGPEEIEGAVREGAYIYGMYMDGARWDVNSGVIEDANMKELYPKLPVMLVKAVPVEKADSRDQYACPVYKTQFRGPTYVFTAGLKTKKPPSKWVMAGVSLLMSVVE